MMAAAPKSPRRGRWGAWAVFIAAWATVVVLALAITALGMTLAGGPAAFQNWLHVATPYALVWRVALYAGGGYLYVTRWRPQLHEMQRRQADGGEAARSRVARIERIVVIALVAIEAANLPGLVD